VLGDHAAHAGPQQVKLVNAQRIHQAQRITGHNAQTVGRTDRQTKAVTQHFIGKVGGGSFGVPAAQADVSVIETDYPKALLAQLLYHIVRPVDQLPAQPHDQ